MSRFLHHSLRAFIVLTALLQSVFVQAQTPDASGTVYVTPTGGGNGSSWSTPTADLQGAINSGATKVFVAIGNYDAPANSFSMKGGVSIYGGFDPANNIKTLSDNRILPNKDMGDGSVLNGNNARTVIKNDNNGLSSISPAILDGFTITGGYTTTYGGGIFNNNVAPVFNNLLIHNNKADIAGGGIFNQTSAPTISNVLMQKNTAVSNGGGAIYSYGTYNHVLTGNGTVTISNATFKENSTVSNFTASVITGVDVPVIVNNAFFEHNVGGNYDFLAQTGAYVVVQTRSTLTLNNVTTVDNERVRDFLSDNATMTINNSVISGYVGSTNGGTYSLKHSFLYNSNNSEDGNIPWNSFVRWEEVFTDYHGEDYTLSPNSILINKGNNALYAGLDGNTTDLVGNPRLSGTAIDIGAYEYPLGVVTPVNGVVYVRPTATGSGLGSSWDNATNSLNNAIQANGVQKVFVAKGTYNVGSSSFVMKNGVEIYGGFDPDNGITNLSQQRIMPDAANPAQGSILNGQNTRPVIWNNGNALNNTAILDGFTITGGSASNGAGIYNQEASPTLRNLIVRNNKATGRGGGMYNNAASPTVSNVVFTGNSVVSTSGAAVYGGAVYNGNSSAPVMTNVTIADNMLQSSGTESGAGIYNDNSSPKIYNSIIWNNTKQTSGASTGADIQSSGSGIVTLKNSITQSYTTGSSADNVLVNFNPLFADASNGNYKLSAASPAVDGGNNTLYTGLGANSKDLAGNARVYNYATGGIIDMGAYESSYNTPFVPDANRIIYVKENATGTGRGNSWENAMSDLHTAITTSNVSNVFVAAGNYNVGSSSFIMKNGVEIYGGFNPDNNIKTLDDNRIMPDASNTQGSVLNGQGVRPVIWNVFTSSTAMDNTAVLDGFTITGGSYSNGAGIRNVHASPVLRNLVIKNNTAEKGAGIYNNNSSPLITNVSIVNNTVTASLNNIEASAILNEYSNAVITNATIARNTITSGFVIGGCISSRNSSVTISNSIIWGNERAGSTTNADVDITNSSSTLILKNSITQVYTTGNASDNNLVGTNPLFTDAGNGRYTLTATSPALNAGSNALFAGLNANTKDLAGNTRVYNYANGGIVDLGAYESAYHSPLTPDANHIIYVKETTTGTGSGKDWDNATADLHNAIHTADVQKVFVAVGNYNAVSSSLLMKNNVEIYGGFDPDNNIRTLNDTRILPAGLPSGGGVGDGSVLNGQNARRVIFNNFTSGTALNNTAVLDGFTIMNGKSTGSGAGIYNYYASPTLRNLVIRNNQASTAGGGIYNNLSSAIMLSNSVVKNNTAQYGGGIYNNSSASILTNVSITGNTATLATTGAGGGGIFNENASLKLTNVLIADNHANFQGGGFRNLSGNPVFTNVTLANNTAGVNHTAIEIAGGTPQINNSIVYGTVTGNYTAQYSLTEGRNSTANGNQDATGITLADIFINPSTGDYTLKYPSPAIDMGSNTLFTGLDENTKDLAGNARVANFNSSGIIDIGAYESAYGTVVPNAGVLYVKPTATGRGDGNSWEHATADLQTAINTAGVQKVFAAIGNYNAPDNGFVMKNGVAIYGGFDPAHNIRTLDDSRILPAGIPFGGTDGAEGSVLNGQNTTTVIRNWFSIDLPMDNTAVLDGFTIKNGYRSANLSPNAGGGMANQAASPTISNCHFTGNSADANAGAMYNISASSPILTNCSFTGNTAGDGYSGGAIFNIFSSSPVLTNCYFSENTATNGGAISNSISSSPVLTNCLITDNSASSEGGGVYNSSGNGTFTNVTLANNGSKGFYASDNTIWKNSIIWDAITGSGYTASYSLIKDKTETASGNIDATGMVVTDIFTNPSANDYTLKSGSPAIDKGNNPLYAGLDANTKDLAGNPRVYNSGIIDLGAYEYQGQEIITSVADQKNNSLNIQIYPNPASEQITISDLTGNEIITIYNQRGTAVVRQKSVGSQALIHLGTMSGGVYHISIVSDTGVSASQKLVIVK